MDTVAIKSKSLDCVIFLSSIHHTPNTDWALKEAYRILKPGCPLLMVELNSLRFTLSLKKRAVHSPDPRECLINHYLLTNQSKVVGFKIESVQLYKQLTNVIELFTRSAPEWIYQVALSLDSVLKNIPLYRELGTMSVIKARKPK